MEYTLMDYDHRKIKAIVEETMTIDPRLYEQRVRMFMENAMGMADDFELGDEFKKKLWKVLEGK